MSTTPDPTDTTIPRPDTAPPASTPLQTTAPDLPAEPADGRSATPQQSTTPGTEGGSAGDGTSTPAALSNQHREQRAAASIVNFFNESVSELRQTIKDRLAVDLIQADWRLAQRQSRMSYMHNNDLVDQGTADSKDEHKSLAPVIHLDQRTRVSAKPFRGIRRYLIKRDISREVLRISRLDYVETKDSGIRATKRDTLNAFIAIMFYLGGLVYVTYEPKWLNLPNLGAVRPDSVTGSIMSITLFVCGFIYFQLYLARGLIAAARVEKRLIKQLVEILAALRDPGQSFGRLSTTRSLNLELLRLEQLVQRLPRAVLLDDLPSITQANERTIAGIRKWRTELLVRQTIHWRLELGEQIRFALEMVIVGDYHKIADADPEKFPITAINNRRRLTLIVSGSALVVIGVGVTALVLQAGLTFATGFGVVIVTVGLYLLKAAGLSLSEIRDTIDLARSSSKAD